MIYKEVGRRPGNLLVTPIVLLSLIPNGSIKEIKVSTFVYYYINNIALFSTLRQFKVLKVLNNSVGDHGKLTKLSPLKPRKTAINFRIPTRYLNELTNYGVLVLTMQNTGHIGYKGISEFLNRAIDHEVRKIRRHMKK